jgi:hypothetical protein
MIFFLFIIIFFKSFIFLIENLYINNILALEIAFCWFVWIVFFENKIKHIFKAPKTKKHINLNIYKILWPKLRVGFVLLYLICFIATLFLLKVYRSVREVSLKQLYFEILQFFSSLDLGQKVCTILFLLTLVYLAILFTQRLKNLIFNEIIKVHLYYAKDQRYFNYIIMPIGLHCHMTVQNTIVCFFSSKVKFLDTKWFHKLVWFFIEHLVLTLSLTFASFDIYFNDFVLTKVFYILPTCFLYSQWLYLSKFYTSKDIFLDDLIHNYLYTKIFFEDENMTMLENGSVIDSDTWLTLDNYIEKGFRIY